MVSILWQDPRRGIDGQEGRGYLQMINPREASLGEEAMTSLKTEGSTREAGDPRSKMKSACGSLGLSFRSLFLTPIVGPYVTNLVNPGIDLTVIL